MQHYARREEWAHTAIHELGFLAGVAALWALLLTAITARDIWQLVGGAIFGVTVLIMFGTSVFYHSASRSDARVLCRKLDHCAIYLLIAGTYTALTLVLMRSVWGWSLFGLVWLAALTGIAVELLSRTRHVVWSSLLYIVMGWSGLLVIKPLIASLTPFQLDWLIAGGLLYTCGVPFYLWKSRPYTHAVWHVFVLSGVGCHYVAVFSAMQ
jgi:hemolysin III